MRREINFKIGFSDGEIISYLRDQEKVEVKVKTWNDKTLMVIFTDVIGIFEIGIGEISNFVEEDNETLFLKTVLNRIYEAIPDKQPYRHFQFLDLDDNPLLEIVAVSQRILKEQ